jgi:hypothetical protein
VADYNRKRKILPARQRTPLESRLWRDKAIPIWTWYEAWQTIGSRNRHGITVYDHTYWA